MPIINENYAVTTDEPGVCRRVAMISVHTSPLAQPGTGDAGGMNVYVLELARRLARQGVAVAIFTRAPASRLPAVVAAADGVRVPRRELSAQYMPRFQQIMAQHPEYYKSIVDETGEFYAFPTHFDIDFGNRGSVLYMSHSVLAQVGEYTYTDHEYFSTIDKAFTTDELYELLRAIKDKTSAIPLSFSSIDDLQPFFWAFG